MKYVRLGALNFASKENDGQPQNFTISEVITHPEWKPAHYYNDIMLLKLEKPASFNKYVRPACLHTTFEIGSTNNKCKYYGLIL